MGKVIADFDAQLNIYRMNYSSARKFDQPDDAVHYAKLLWSSLPSDIRDKYPLPEMSLDRSLRSKLDSSGVKWRWCREAMPIVEQAIADHRNELLRKWSA